MVVIIRPTLVRIKGKSDWQAGCEPRNGGKSKMFVQQVASEISDR